MMKTWHIDACPGASDTLISAMDPNRPGFHHTIAVAKFDRAHVVAAVRTILLRTAPDWPEVIVTDNAVPFSGLGALIGISQRFPDPREMLEQERIARALIAKSCGDAQ